MIWSPRAFNRPLARLHHMSARPEFRSPPRMAISSPRRVGRDIVSRRRAHAFGQRNCDAMRFLLQTF
jgi:hypothetical protein